MTKYLVQLAAVFMIGLTMTLALANNVNGMLLATGLMLIAGIAGYTIGKK